MKGLTRVASRGDEYALKGISQRLEHKDGTAREAAVDALAILAPVDQHIFVRKAAVRRLADVAKKGNVNAIDAVSLRLEHRDAAVRQAAVKGRQQQH